MNHTEVVDGVAEKSGLPRKEAASAMAALVEIVTDCLKKGDEARLTGLGAFVVVSRQARKGRNPSTGAEIDIPASVKAGFKAGKSLNDALKS